MSDRASTAYAYNWDFGIQREIAGIIRDPGFRGAQALNERFYPFPRFGRLIRYALFQGNSVYNGLVISGKIRTRLLDLGGSHTWSHTLDNDSSYGGATYDVSQPGAVQAFIAGWRLSGVTTINTDPDDFFDPAHFGKIETGLCPGYSAASGVHF